MVLKREYFVGYYARSTRSGFLQHVQPSQRMEIIGHSHTTRAGTPMWNSRTLRRLLCCRNLQISSRTNRLLLERHLVCDWSGHQEGEGVSGRPGMYILQTFWVSADSIFSQIFNMHIQYFFTHFILHTTPQVLKAPKSKDKCKAGRCLCYRQTCLPGMCLGLKKNCIFLKMLKLFSLF